MTYEVNLGMLNTFSPDGRFVMSDSLDTIIARIEDSKSPMLGEIGKPVKDPNETMPQFIGRYKNTRLHNVGFEIMKISLVITEEQSELPTFGKKVIIKGVIRPTGAMGHVVEELFKDDKAKYTFALRGFVEDLERNSIKFSNIKGIITYDLINN